MPRFDIETGPLPQEEVLRNIPEFDEEKAVPKLPPFDEDSIKCGNLTAENAKKKIDAARADHEDKIRNRPFLVDLARNEYIKNAMSKAALSPLTGCVLTIGYLFKDGEILIPEQPEDKVLTEFWNTWERYYLDEKFVGHNINGFDLPFLVRRSWQRGVKVPHNVVDGRGYFHSSFVDLMKIWGLGDKTFIKLDRMGEILGCGRKTEGMDGGDFARLWNGTKKDRREAKAYLTTDLVLTDSVASRMGY